MYDQTGLQRDLLYVIAGLTEPHGLAIKEELEDYYEQEVHHGRLYPNLVGVYWRIRVRDYGDKLPIRPS